jgi:cyclic-di-GMP phosphodiesterase TipF (flagellum assembly factor)
VGSIVAHLFIAILYIAVGVAAALLLPRAGVPMDMAIIAGLGVGLIAALCHVALAAVQRHGQMAERIEDLEAAQEEMHKTLASHESELAQLHWQVENDTSRRSDELVAEMKVLHGLLARLQEQRGETQQTASHSRADRPDESSEQFDDDEVTSIVRNALEANRIDLYLQPIVSLPSRKTLYYEAYSRIRNEAGTVVYPRQYLHLAEREGLISNLDNLLMFRCIQVVRQSEKRHPERQFFVNISSATLSDEGFITQFMEFMEDNAELAGRVIMEIAQSDIKGMDRVIESRLTALSGAGFSFSMDHVTDLDIDFHGLHLRGFKFIKIGAPTFFGQDGPLHRADFNEAVKRNGLRLILEKIEDDATLVELLDHDVELGQGYLFGAPRRSALD